MPALIAGVKRKPAESQARDLLDLLGLGDKARQAPATLVAASGSAWPSPGRWPTSPRPSWPTSPPKRFDSEGGEEVLELFRRLHAGGQTSCSSPTTSRWPTRPSGS